MVPNVEPSLTLNDTTSDKLDTIETFTPEPAPSSSKGTYKLK